MMRPAEETRLAGARILPQFEGIGGTERLLGWAVNLDPRSAYQDISAMEVPAAGETPADRRTGRPRSGRPRGGRTMFGFLHEPLHGITHIIPNERIAELIVEGKKKKGGPDPITPGTP